ncbi:MAG: hypothetical protein KA151_05050 [Piscinibacter sp.]|jgi:hypothetical protein|nr:hypothetical protein [Piscinibacter sp.]
MKRRHILLIIWPSFVIAGLLEMLVFNAADPADMKGFGGLLTQLSSTGVYTIAFFSFWALCALGTALTLMLAAPTRAEKEEGG